MATFIRKKITRRAARRRDISAVNMQRFESTRAALDRAVRRCDANAA